MFFDVQYLCVITTAHKKMIFMNRKTMKTIKWRSIAALILVLTGFFFDLTWLWGLLFLMWVIPDFFSGETFLMERISRKEDPILYWTILVVWLVSSIYLLVDAFVPQSLPKGWSTESQYLYVTEQRGTYVLDYNQHEQEPDTIYYKDYLSDSFNVVGLSTWATYENNAYDSILQGLWQEFQKEDISVAIPDVMDDKIYLIQSDFNDNGKFRVTLGYQSASLKASNKALKGVRVAASKYAVLELAEAPEKTLPLVLEKIALSDLKTTNLNNVEVYHYDWEKKQIQKIDVWMAVPTSQAALNRLKKALDKNESKDTLKPIVTAQKIAAPYKNEVNTASVEKEIEEAWDEVVDNYKPQYSVVKHPALSVVGIQKQVAYKEATAINKATEALWEQFFKKNYARHIKGIDNPNKIYVTYNNYTDKLVTITMGYAVAKTATFRPNKGLKKVTINANDYHQFKLEEEASSIGGKEWDTLMEVLQYRSEKSSDFEVYTFDNKYNITNAFMWVSIK